MTDAVNPDHKGQKDREKISVIVPFYNAVSVLPDCVKSLLAQTWGHLEILLMDDGSSDGSAALCDRYAKEDPRIRVFHLPHKGVAAARNAGLKAYTADYLMFADADDLCDPHYAEYLFEALDRSGLPISYCLAKDIAGPSPGEYRCNLPADFPKGRVEILPVSEYQMTSPASHRVIWGAIFRRSILEGLSFAENYAVSTDTLFMAQVLHRCEKAAFLPLPLYLYVIGHPSVSNRPFDRVRYDDVRVWEEIAELFSDLPGTPAISTRVCRDRKYQSFLWHMVREHSEDKALEKHLIKKVRFRYLSAVYKRKDPGRILRSLIYVTWPELYLFLVRKKHSRDREASS